MATIEQLTGMDEATAARHCQAAHTELVETLMEVIDMFDLVQRDGNRVDVAKLRRHIGAQMRHSAIDHATALAALVLESAPEYADELIDYAESVPAEAVA
jgi:hypothetical protein